MPAGQLKPNLDAIAQSMKGTNVPPAVVQTVKQLFEQVIEMSLADCVKGGLVKAEQVGQIKTVAMNSFAFGVEPVRDFEAAGEGGDSIADQLANIRGKVAVRDEKGQLMHAVGGPFGLDKLDWLVERAFRAVVAAKLVSEKDIGRIAGYAFRSYTTPANRV